MKYKESFSFDKEGVLKGEGNYEYDLKGNPLKTYGMFYSQNEMQEETYEYTYFEDGQLKSRRQCWYTSKVITSGYYIEFNSSHECVTELKLRYENGKLSVYAIKNGNIEALGTATISKGVDFISCSTDMWSIIKGARELLERMKVISEKYPRCNGGSK